MDHQDPRLTRRAFLGTSAAAAGGLLLGGLPGCRDSREQAAAPAPAFVPSNCDYQRWREIFRTIVQGFIVNAQRTSPDSFAVCDYAGGLILQNFVSRSGQTCDSVARLLPALAAAIAAPQGAEAVEVEGRSYDLTEVFLAAFRHGTDPSHPDFWQYARPDGGDQRQVESSILAWSLWLAADRVMDRFTAQERRNLQAWLESCTRFTGHTNNWKLFTAVNQAARLALAERWPEFSGSEEAFRADLAPLERMYQGDGWYHDSLEGHEYDYYNFWVFASHHLYWDMMVGERFPALRQIHRERLELFLRTTPHFFGGNGSHVLYGRSLIYRWAALTPLTLAHRAGLWPLSTGLLRRICNRNLAFLWEAGAWDQQNLKLRETMTPHSSREVCESYINNGHPYWGMQAFAALALPPEDPFWTAPEEPLPVEAGDFSHLIQAPGILLRGDQASGQVRMFQSRSDGHYPNKYFNFSYSSHFPYNVGMVADLVPPDCMLSFEDAAGNYGRRVSAYTGEVLSEDSLRWSWSAKVGEREIKVESLALLAGEVEWRAHRLEVPPGAPLTAVESTCALGLELDEQPEARSGERWQYGRSPRQGCAVFVRGLEGYGSGRELAGFRGRDDLNSFAARARQCGVAATLEPGRQVLAAALYASPRPLSPEELLKRTARLPQAIKDFIVL